MKTSSTFKKLYFFILAFLACNLVNLIACSNSDDYLFNQSETTFIQVNAYVTESFENSADRKKQDTLIPGDSVIFLASISPSKSIRMQKYFWTMDGTTFANEFSFKSTIKQPGFHQMAFVLVDHFGDTLSDTLNLYVATPPVLDTVKFFPRSETNKIAATDPLSFAWSLAEEDSLWDVFYRFTLQEITTEKTVVDTILTSPQFIYRMGFKPLEKYSWKVKAFNELAQESKETLNGSFSTAGQPKEGGISGYIKSSYSTANLPFTLNLLDTSNIVCRTVHMSAQGEKFFNISPVKSGRYKLTASVDGFPDYPQKSYLVNVKEGLFTDLGTIFLEDTIPPSIQHIDSLDTLTIADTLRFIISDGGGNLTPSRISAKLETKTVTGTVFSGDTLSVPLPELNNSWTYRLLTIIALDQSGNKTSRTFYVRPSKTLDEVLND